jgi:hypothetical protein
LSGYETDSSTSTDIDAAVAEFKENLHVATVTPVPELLITPKPDDRSSKKARLAMTSAFFSAILVCGTLLLVCKC